MKKDKSSKYYEALDRAFKKLEDTSAEEFNALLQSHANSEVTNLLLGYAYSNSLDTVESNVSSSFSLESSCFGMLAVSYEPETAALYVPMSSIPSINSTSSTTSEDPNWNLILAA